MPKRMPKPERMSVIFCVPITPTLKEQIDALAKAEDRTPVQMARKLWKEALVNRQRRNEMEAVA